MALRGLHRDLFPKFVLHICEMFLQNDGRLFMESDCSCIDYNLRITECDSNEHIVYFRVIFKISFALIHSLANASRTCQYIQHYLCLPGLVAPRPLWGTEAVQQIMRTLVAITYTW